MTNAQLAAKVSAIQAGLRRKMMLSGRAFWICASLGAASWWISMHAPGAPGFWIWRIGLALDFGALTAAERWNTARLQLQISPFE